MFTPKRRGKPGPKGLCLGLIAAILEIKRLNSRFGCRRIAKQLSFTNQIVVDKDMVRRSLALFYRPVPDYEGAL